MYYFIDVFIKIVLNTVSNSIAGGFGFLLLVYIIIRFTICLGIAACWM